MIVEREETEVSRAQGTTKQRGYGAKHKALRRRWATLALATASFSPLVPAADAPDVASRNASARRALS